MHAWHDETFVSFIKTMRLIDTPSHQIRAQYNAQTIRVYQAYSDEIAEPALRNGKFVTPPFKLERMTWIKPSFLWMMYRAGWGYKDSGQQRILAIDITHEGFAWALEHSCLSHAEGAMSKEEWLQLKQSKPVRVQWDPERDLQLQALPYRAIQIGLSGEAVNLYVNTWTLSISDVTPLAHQIYGLLQAGDTSAATALLPQEREYIPLRGGNFQSV